MTASDNSQRLHLPTTQSGEPASSAGGTHINKIRAVNVGREQNIDMRGTAIEIPGDVTNEFTGGDKITVGDISGSGVAIGREASAYFQREAGNDELAQALAALVTALQHSVLSAATQAAALRIVEELTEVLAQGAREA